MTSLDDLLLEMFGQPFLQCGHRLGQSIGPIVLEDQPSVVDSPNDNPYTLLDADLDMAGTLGNGI